jgi:hypothetical protein
METTTPRAARTSKRTAAEKQVRIAAPKQVRKLTDRVKTTIVMDGSLDFRLASVSASLGMDKSELAAKLIDSGLRPYALDGLLRQFTDRPEIAGHVSESKETAA